MLPNQVNHIFGTGVYTIQYPMLEDFEIDQIAFPNYDFVLKPMSLTKVLEGPRRYLSMQFSTVGYKSLYQKIRHLANYNLRMSQDVIIDHIVHLYAEIRQLHSIPQLAGALYVQQLFYKEKQRKLYIAGFLNDEIKPRFPLLYHRSAILDYDSDSLALSYVLYCMLTCRFPPIPFLCYLKLSRDVVDVQGNYNFFRYILKSSEAPFKDIKDHVIAKFSQQYKLPLPESKGPYQISIDGLQECIEVVKGFQGLNYDGFIVLLRM